MCTPTAVGVHIIYMVQLVDENIVCDESLLILISKALHAGFVRDIRWGRLTLPYVCHVKSAVCVGSRICFVSEGVIRIHPGAPFINMD